MTLPDVVDRRWTWTVGSLVSILLSIVLAYFVVSQVNALAVQYAILDESVKAMRVEFDDVKAHGSPITDKRLTVLEYKVGIK